MYGRSTYGSSPFGGSQTLPNITIQNTTVESIPCVPCDTPPCTTSCNVVCPGGSCPSTIVVTVTWENSGGVDGTFSPIATIGSTTIFSVPTSITVPAGLTAYCTFTIPGLERGMNNICIDSGTVI